MADDVKQPRKRGWGMAEDPKTAKGSCEFSRKTPLNTFDCILEKNMKDFEPLLFPGKKFGVHRACKHQEDMRKCPDYKRKHNGN